MFTLSLFILFVFIIKCAKVARMGRKGTKTKATNLLSKAGKQIFTHVVNKNAVEDDNLCFKK
jgi:hypothetical protein